MTGAEAKAKLEAFLAAQPGLFAVAHAADGRSAEIFERVSGKSLKIAFDELSDAAVKTSPIRPHPYLVLVWQDGRQVALADVGFAFAPSTRSTGPLPELPETFCFRDLRHLVSGARSLIDQEGRELESVRAILMSLALLDGARSLGFDIEREERELDAVLSDLEKRGLGT